ncbi:TPA: hypothetical protein U5D50_004280 [Yersinia enterocolitica]|nr:hypothetical protein [Yersinia enterocolitica]
MLKKYPDILERAIKNPTEEEALLLHLTDHGWVTESDFNLLLERRVTPMLKKQVYSKTTDNGEIWMIFPDGTKKLRFDRFGNSVDSERVTQ